MSNYFFRAAEFTSIFSSRKRCCRTLDDPEPLCHLFNKVSSRSYEKCSQWALRIILTGTDTVWQTDQSQLYWSGCRSLICHEISSGSWTNSGLDSYNYMVSSNKLGFPPVSTGTVVIMDRSSMEGIAQYTQHSVHTSGQGKPAIFGSRWEPGSKQIHFIWNVLNGSKCWCANQNRTSVMLLYKLQKKDFQD